MGLSALSLWWLRSAMKVTAWPDALNFSFASLDFCLWSSLMILYISCNAFSPASLACASNSSAVMSPGLPYS
jgi:hypothetical protein